ADVAAQVLGVVARLAVLDGRLDGRVVLEDLDYVHHDQVAAEVDPADEGVVAAVRGPPGLVRGGRRRGGWRRRGVGGGARGWGGGRRGGRLGGAGRRRPVGHRDGGADPDREHHQRAHHDHGRAAPPRWNWGWDVLVGSVLVESC